MAKHTFRQELNNFLKFMKNDNKVKTTINTLLHNDDYDKQKNLP